MKKVKGFSTVLGALLIWVSAQSASALEVVISAAGDLSFSDNHLKGGIPDVSADGVYDAGKFYAYEDLTRYIESLFWNSDLNFANVETVLAQSKRGLKSPKAGSSPNGTYTFISHPKSLEHMIEKLNLNLFSLANNHAFDFGASGLAETYASMREIKINYDFVEYAGIYPVESAIRPIEFDFQGYRVAFAAVKSPTGAGAGAFKLIPMGSRDYNTLIAAFGRSAADIKIMSVHEGVEGKVTVDGGQAGRYRSAVDQGGLNLILAHHPHVVRPVEVYRGSAIFYSLGNFLILGASNIDSKAVSHSYGLVARSYFQLGQGPARLTAIEAIPIKGMHNTPYVPKSEVAGRSIAYLNQLNRSVDYGVEFRVTSRGTGVLCLENTNGARQKKICP